MTVTEATAAVGGPTPREESITAAEERLGELMGVLNTTTAAVVETLAQVLEAGLWEVAGIRSPEHWVTWRLGVSPSRARSLVGMARRWASLPATAAAFRAGSLTEDQVAVLSRHVPAAGDRQAAELAAVAMVPQLARATRPLRPTVTNDDDAAEARREVSFGHGDDGWWCRMHLPPDEGTQVEGAIVAGRDAVFAERHPEAEPNGARKGGVDWADGALRMAGAATCALSADAPARATRAQVLVHLSLDDPDRHAHLHLGPALPADLRRLLDCDASLQVVFEAGGSPVVLAATLFAHDPAALHDHQSAGLREHEHDASPRVMRAT